MTISYNLAPNGRWSARQQTGFAAVNGLVYTYQNKTRVDKATFQDPGGLNPNTNPIQLDGSGEANIYWADDEYYTILVYGDDGELLYSQDNYPVIGGGSGGDIIVNETAQNLIRNAQFLRWGNNDFNLLADSTTVYTRLGTHDEICDDFRFDRSNTNCTVKISQQQFNVGQTQVPCNPINYLQYQCTDVGAGAEVNKKISQRFDSAQFLSNKEISFGIYAMSPNSDEISFSIRQNFGSGGSPSNDVSVTLSTVELTPVWTKYEAFGTVPSVAGKNFGTNGDDYFAIEINLPLNAIANISICNKQLHAQNTLPAFPSLSVYEQLMHNNTTTIDSTFRTGDYVLSIDPSFRGYGWILCNDLTIGSFFSGAHYPGNYTLPLFLLLWDTIPNAYLPIYNSAGVVTTRGASAIADFNADKRLSITRTLGRALASSGTGSGLTARSIGQYVGEETHVLTTPEIPSHTHTYSALVPGSGIATGASTISVTSAETVATGGGLAHNNMQPTLFLNCFIKL